MAVGIRIVWWKLEELCSVDSVYRYTVEFSIIHLLLALPAKALQSCFIVWPPPQDLRVLILG